MHRSLRSAIHPIVSVSRILYAHRCLMYNHRLWVNRLTLMEFATGAARMSQRFGSRRWLETQGLNVPSGPSQGAAQSLSVLARHLFEETAAAQTP